MAFGIPIERIPVGSRIRTAADKLHALVLADYECFQDGDPLSCALRTEVGAHETETNLSAPVIVWVPTRGRPALGTRAEGGLCDGLVNPLGEQTVANIGEFIDTIELHIWGKDFLESERLHGIILVRLRECFGTRVIEGDYTWQTQRNPEIAIKGELVVQLISLATPIPVVTVCPLVTPVTGTQILQVEKTTSMLSPDETVVTSTIVVDPTPDPPWTP